MDCWADEEGIILALEQRDRICRIHLGMSITNLQKFIMAINDEYPILECLIIMHVTEDKSTILKLPETLQAPHLRHLRLITVVFPFQWDLDYSRLRRASSRSFLSWATHPRTSIQMLCSNGFH